MGLRRLIPRRREKLQRGLDVGGDVGRSGYLVTVSVSMTDERVYSRLTNQGLLCQDERMSGEGRTRLAEGVSLYVT